MVIISGHCRIGPIYMGDEPVKELSPVELMLTSPIVIVMTGECIGSIEIHGYPS